MKLLTTRGSQRRSSVRFAFDPRWPGVAALFVRQHSLRRGGYFGRISEQVKLTRTTFTFPPVPLMNAIPHPWHKFVARLPALEVGEMPAGNKKAASHWRGGL